MTNIVLGFEFQKDRLKNVGAVWVEFLAFPLTWHIAYTTACYYRTSHDNVLKLISTGELWVNTKPATPRGLRHCHALLAGITLDTSTLIMKYIKCLPGSVVALTIKAATQSINHRLRHWNWRL